jgi:hypothetical protein
MVVEDGAFVYVGIVIILAVCRMGMFWFLMDVFNALTEMNLHIKK